MYSCNVPVPTEVARLASGLAGETGVDATTRDRHTLVLKRLGDDDPRRLSAKLRAALAGLTPFPVRVTGVDAFETPTRGRAPVVYLAVDSPVLESLHERLCETFPPVDGVEGADYVPHITIARGPGARPMLDRRVEPVEWTVDRLLLWAARYGEPVEQIALPV